MAAIAGVVRDAVSIRDALVYDPQPKLFPNRSHAGGLRRLRPHDTSRASCASFGPADQEDQCRPS